MSVANLANVKLHLKAQSALNTPASGAGATGIEVRASRGLEKAVQTIESQMIQRSRMRKRPRHGSVSSLAAYETELQVGNLDTVLEAVLGGTWQAEQTFSDADWGTCTISGSGVTITFGSGTLLTDGVRAGMFLRFTNLSVSANNAKWVPIVSVDSETVCQVASGILADNTSDAAWSVELAGYVHTATPYTDRYFTVEEYLTEIDRSKLGTDMRFNSLNFAVAPNDHIVIGFGLGGIDMDLLATGSSPTFSSPTFTDGPSLTLLDGGIYKGATKLANVTGFTWGLQAPVSTLPTVTSLVSPDVFLGQFAFTGQFAAALEDGAHWDDFDAETQLSMILHCAEDGGVEADFVGFYLPNLTYAGFSTPAGGEGPVIQTLPLYGGEDERGTGYAATTVLVSASNQ